jgi:hypothetical protein
MVVGHNKAMVISWFENRLSPAPSRFFQIELATNVPALRQKLNSK